jgi:hypothetical protein
MKANRTLGDSLFEVLRIACCGVALLKAPCINNHPLRSEALESSHFALLTPSYVSLGSQNAA